MTQEQPTTLEEWKAISICEGLGTDQTIREYILNQAKECTSFGIEGKSVIAKTGIGHILMTRKNDLVFIEWLPKADGTVEGTQRQKMRFWEHEDNAAIVALGQHYRKHPELRQPFEKVMGEV